MAGTNFYGTLLEILTEFENDSQISSKCESDECLQYTALSMHFSGLRGMIFVWDRIKSLSDKLFASLIY